MINARALLKVLHTWIISVFWKQHLVQTGRIDGPTVYLSRILAAFRSPGKRTSQTQVGSWGSADRCLGVSGGRVRGSVPAGEEIFIELMVSDRKLEVFREGPQ